MELYFNEKRIFLVHYLLVSGIKNANTVAPTNPILARAKKLILNPKDVAIQPATALLNDDPTLADKDPNPCKKLKRPVPTARSELITVPMTPMIPAAMPSNI